LVEQGTENPRVGGSIPSLGTIPPHNEKAQFGMSDDRRIGPRRVLDCSAFQLTLTPCGSDLQKAWQQSHSMKFRPDRIAGLRSMPEMKDGGA
jgi:hypothetical protein